MAAPEAKLKNNIQLPAGVYAINPLSGAGSRARGPRGVPSLGHAGWPSVGKGRLGGELVERSGGRVESKCPPLPALSLFLGQPIHFTNLFAIFNRFAWAELFAFLLWLLA